MKNDTNFFAWKSGIELRFYTDRKELCFDIEKIKKTKLCCVHRLNGRYELAISDSVADIWDYMYIRNKGVPKYLPLYDTPFMEMAERVYAL